MRLIELFIILLVDENLSTVFQGRILKEFFTSELAEFLTTIITAKSMIISFFSYPYISMLYNQT